MIEENNHIELSRSLVTTIIGCWSIEIKLRGLYTQGAERNKGRLEFPLLMRRLYFIDLHFENIRRNYVALVHDLMAGM